MILGAAGTVTAGLNASRVNGVFNPCLAGNTAAVSWNVATRVSQAGQIYGFVSNVANDRWLEAGVDGVMLAHSTWQALRACFAAGTPIRTPEGSKPIEALQPGDLVLSRGEHDPEGAVSPKVVEEVFQRTGRVWLLRLEGGVTIRTTPEHPFFPLRTMAWTPAAELQVGDVLCGETGDVRVEAIEDTGEYASVYNCRVADWHTYFVGCQECGVWAHNATYGELDESNPQHAEVKSVFTSAANLLRGPLNLLVKTWRVFTGKNMVEFENTSFETGYRPKQFNTKTRVDDPATHNPTITVDDDFLALSPQAKQYVALHELHHADMWRRLVEKHEGRLNDANNELHRLSRPYSERAYTETEIHIENSVKSILAAHYGGEAHIPADVLQMMQTKMTTEVANLKQQAK